jgi:amino acid transporter
MNTKKNTFKSFFMKNNLFLFALLFALIICFIYFIINEVSSFTELIVFFFVSFILTYILLYIYKIIIRKTKEKPEKTRKINKILNIFIIVLVFVVIVFIFVNSFTKPTLTTFDLIDCKEGRYKAPNDLQETMLEKYNTKISYIDIFIINLEDEELLSKCHIKTTYSNYKQPDTGKKIKSTTKIFGVDYIDSDLLEDVYNNQDNLSYTYLKYFHTP